MENKNPCLDGSHSRVIRSSVWLDDVSCGSCEIRCYATINFVDDSSSEPKESIPSRVPVERIRTEKTSRKQKKQMKVAQRELTSRRHGAPLDYLHAKKPPRQQSVPLSRHEGPTTPNWKFSGSKDPSKDGDDFSELGEPLIPDGDAGAKFVNKTQETSLNMETAIPRLMHFSSHGNSMVKNGTETWKGYLEKGPSHKINLVTVEEIPSSLSVSDLKKAASAYGNIVSASMRAAQNGFKRCEIEFESVESMERALVARHVAIGNFHLPVRSLQTAKVVTVRISSICPETTEPSIHSVCMRYGSVVGLTRTKDGAVEVLFNIWHPIGAENIVKKLNDVCISNCKWSAQLLSENLPNTTDVDDAKCGVESQIMCLIRDFKKHIEMKKIYLEDLEELHQAVVHMRDCPSASDL
ncbi:hypothetical protein ACLOJK_026402 [Asimina triloba]